MNESVFSRPFVEGLGQAILDYFECETFPMGLLQDPLLNSLYTKVQLMKTVKDESLPDEECDTCINAIIDASRKRVNSKRVNHKRG